jgi:CheY-like chemotaxis protein
MSATTPVAAPALSSHDTHLPTSSILVVDDVPQNVELLQAYLETLNCTVHVAVDGIDALEKVPKVNPDLILLDIMMPRMSGFEVCRRLKAAPKTRDIPILMVTALNELGDIERGVEAGTDDFLTKPVNKLELLTRVKSLLRVRHLKNQLDRTLAYLSDMENRPEPDPQ